MPKQSNARGTQTCLERLVVPLILGNRSENTEHLAVSLCSQDRSFFDYNRRLVLWVLSKKL